MHNFSNGLVSPALAYSVSCLGAFLGLRCIARASYYQGRARAWWLATAAMAIGATSIWAMHFIAMLGFAIPGQVITYNVPVTLASMLIAVAAVGIGLFIVEYGKRSKERLLTGGLIVGIGVAAMHYLGMAAMVTPDPMSYNPLLFIASVVIAIAAGTTALWIGTWVRSIPATLGASLVMGLAVCAMHYTGMAAMHVYAGHSQNIQMASSSGASSDSFLLPLVLGISGVTFVLTLIICMTPSEYELREDAEFNARLDALQQRAG